jgi:hypothetical protein
LALVLLPPVACPPLAPHPAIIATAVTVATASAALCFMILQIFNRLAAGRTAST